MIDITQIDIRNDPPQPSRRLKRFSIYRSDLWSMFVASFDGAYLHCPILLGIPDGAKLVNVYEDYNSASFCLVVEHESFDEVVEGGIPEIYGALSWVDLKIPTNEDTLSKLLPCIRYGISALDSAMYVSKEICRWFKGKVGALPE